MLQALLDVILPVVLVAGVGAIIGRTLDVDIASVNRVSLYGFTPALTYRSLVTTSASLGSGARLVAAYLLAMAIAAVVALAVVAVTRTSGRATVVGCTIIGNNGNFGLPIALLALGQTGLDQALVIFVTSVLIMFTVGPMLLGARDGLVGGIRRVVMLPVMWTLVAGLVVRGVGWQTPKPVMSAVDLLADAAVPVVLLGLGMQLARSSRIHLTRPVLVSVATRFVAVPLAAYAAGILLGLDASGLRSLVLACVMPTAVNAFMLAREFGADHETAASVVALSTFASIPLIAATVAILPRLG